MGSPYWKSVSELENIKGKLYFDGCDLSMLAKKYGTPTYVYSESRIRSNYRRLLKAYRDEYPNFDLYYAIKANNNPAILSILASEGAGMDASCIPEVLLAKSCSVPSSRILYSGVYNSDADLKCAIEHNVRINLEDASQLERLKKISIPEFLCFRVNPGIGISGVEGLIFAGPDAKFGIMEKEIGTVYAKAKQLGVTRFGIHMMTGSNVLKPHYFAHVVEKLLDIAGPLSQSLGIRFDFIDIGGSLGVPYRPEEEELDIKQVAKEVTSVLKGKLHKYNMGEPLLLHESGRYLTCDAGVLLTSVTSVKRAEKTFVGLDSGMHTLLRPALYGAYHHLLYANDLSKPCDMSAHIVGQICENTDVFAKDRPIPSCTQVGDLLAILNVGSYGFCMSSQYNSQPKAAEVLVSQGESHLIRERETWHHLLQGTHRPRNLQ